MTSTPSAGYFSGGQPYTRIGHGPRTLVIFQGLEFENKPPSPFMLKMYKFLEEAYTIFAALPRPGLPAGYTMKDLADDYAGMIRAEFGQPVDVLGVSTGGSVVQHFAADHPDLLRRLVIHSSAYTLSESAKRLQLRIGQLAQQRRWVQAWALMMDAVLPQRGIAKALSRPLVWLGAPLMGLLGAPKDPSDLVTIIAAEDQHDFRARLAEITAPTLVIAGDQDPFYSPDLFRATAAGIPNAKLVLYPGMGHPAMGKQFSQEVLAFLNAAES